MINWAEFTIHIPYPSIAFMQLFATFWLVQTLICLPGVFYVCHLINTVKRTTLFRNNEKKLLKNVAWWFGLSPLAFILIPLSVRSWIRRKKASES